jgi:hypothetical protein
MSTPVLDVHWGINPRFLEFQLKKRCGQACDAVEAPAPAVKTVLNMYRTIHAAIVRLFVPASCVQTWSCGIGPVFSNS